MFRGDSVGDTLASQCASESGVYIGGRLSWNNLGITKATCCDRCSQNPQCAHWAFGSHSDLIGNACVLFDQRARPADWEGYVRSVAPLSMSPASPASITEAKAADIGPDGYTEQLRTSSDSPKSLPGRSSETAKAHRG
eukprot:TRINITY_DN12786_c0_g1_i1.p1 TRINITY_DN12786_c0_g1~~TRINITY_DN12786_c0_g1_i1.p1  ORF type:complete len:149 (+),score=20.30 TRINITY_DN12786_c0_g1_i1:36-449(+)